MDVSPSTDHLTISAPAGASPSLPTWAAGQRLMAIVLMQTGPQSVSLRIGNQTLEANTALALPPRSQLQLEVVQAGAQPVLRIVPTPAGAADPVGAALREAVPRQAPLREVFAALHLLAANTPPRAGLTPPTLALITQLLAQIPTAAGIMDVAGLRRALRDAGMSLEHKLARGSATDVADDLKGKFLKLSSALDGQPVDSEARRWVGAGLARIELHQLTALAQTTPDQGFTVELPLRRDTGIDVVQLRIERDTNSADMNGEKNWSVWIQFDIEPIGPVQAKVSLCADTLSALLWAERIHGVQLINSHLSELDQALKAAGLQVQQLQCFGGPPPHDPFTALPSQLVDIHA